MNDKIMPFIEKDATLEEAELCGEKKNIARKCVSKYWLLIVVERGSCRHSCHFRGSGK